MNKGQIILLLIGLAYIFLAKPLARIQPVFLRLFGIRFSQGKSVIIIRIIGIVAITVALVSGKLI